jgi:hypothetical protein
MVSTYADTGTVCITTVQSRDASSHLTQAEAQKLC